MASSPSIPASVPPAPLTVLVVDDDGALRTLIGRWLGQSGMELIEAANGEEALAAVAERGDRIDGIVLDVMLPGMDGFETLGRLRTTPGGAAIPVVLLTAHATTDKDVLRGLSAGAYDHMSKPFSGPLLAAKIKALCERGRGERDLRSRLVRAEQTAAFDSLTGLRNRRAFESKLREEVANARRRTEPFSVVVLDLDHFKSVNDTFGHHEGDRVLTHFAQILEELFRADDAAFRYGGEEFVLVLRACSADNAVVAVNRLRNTLATRPIPLGDKREPRAITFSAGVAVARADEQYAASKLVERADSALYRAKRGGRDRVEVSTD